MRPQTQHTTMVRVFAKSKEITVESQTVQFVIPGGILVIYGSLGLSTFHAIVLGASATYDALTIGTESL
jgi:hypothetical protein